MAQVSRVLLVEDNPGDARLIAETLSDIGRDIQLDIRDSLSSAIDALNTNEYDVVLLDLGLPESVGLETLTRLRDSAPGVATIVLTGNTDTHLAVSAVDEGAQDFLVKGRVDAEMLDRAMAYATSRKRVQGELLRQTKLLAEAQEVAHLGSWRVDLQTGDVSWSDEMYRIFGLTKEIATDDVRDTILSMTHPDDRTLVSSLWDLMESKAQMPPIECRILQVDGNTRWLYWRANWERDESGTPIALAGIVQDITERREAQEAIRLSEEFNRALVEGLDQHAVLMLTDDGRCVDWNAGAQRLFDLPESETSAVQLSDLAVHDAGQADLADAVRTTLADGRATTTCLLRRGASGEFMGSISLSSVGCDGEHVRGIAVIVHDITESTWAADRDAVRSAVGKALDSAESLEAAWPDVLRAACFGLGWEIGEAWILDEASGDLCFASLWTADRTLTEGLESCNSRFRYRYSETGPLAAMRSGSSKFGTDLSWVSTGVRTFELRRVGAESFAVVPIADGSRAFGVIIFFASRPPANEYAMQQILEEIGNRIAEFAARERLRQQVVNVGLFDALTGLPNRALFTDRLAQALSRRPLRGDPAVLVVLAELDQIDRVSDTYGHHVADRVLLSVAERIRSSLGADDAIARLWGGVLAILVNDVDQGTRETAVLDRISATLASPVEIEGATVYATVSTGSTRGGSSENPEEMLRCANIALHRARELGLGGRVLFDQGMRDFAEREVSTEGELRRGIDQGEFEVFYQPIVSLSSHRIVGAEALIRWRHPTRGLVLPGEFIPTAEGSGLIGILGEFVLRTACEECGRWTVPGREPIGISVNLSASQFRAEDLAQGVLLALQETRLHPDRLTVEITESIIMSDAEKASRVLERLREVGVGVSVDDFGTGYSSLSYLKRLPIDKVKIDRSFVSGIPQDPDDIAIVLAVQNMAHALGLEVIAEGVEQHGQLQFLGHHGCDYAQGFLFSRAVPAEEFRRMLQDWEYVDPEEVATLVDTLS